MLYTIEGFSQEGLIRLHLDAKDAVLLRWFLLFQTSGHMEERIFKQRRYYWVNYKYVTRELPILDISSSDVLRRRFKFYVKKEIMAEYLPRKSKKSYYRLTPKFYKLVSDMVKHLEIQPELPDLEICNDSKVVNL